MGAWVVSKIPSLSPRASPSALGLRDGIFDTTLAPIWYYDNASKWLFGRNLRSHSHYLCSMAQVLNHIVFMSCSYAYSNEN